jgi:glycerol-3-phosphate O-acyltransferase
VNGAIAELALLRASEEGADTFWDEAMRLRDLLKFEFFFAEKDEFRAELRAEIGLHDPEWEERLAGGSGEIIALLHRFRPFSAPRVLRPFLEAYRVVADVLERRDPAVSIADNELLAACLALGKQYELQRRILSAESVSKALFSNGLALAKNRGLLTTVTPEPISTRVTTAVRMPDLGARRRAFAAEVREAIRRVDAMSALVAARYAGLID